MYDATWLLRRYASRRIRHLARQDPGQAQRAVLASLIRRAQGTEFGRDHGFSPAWPLDEYRSRVPLRDYDAFWETYWREPFPRLDGCTWPGRIPWFAESSGTTTGTTKYIPVSREMRRSNVRAGADLLAFHLGQPAVEPAARRARLHARRLDRAGPPRAGRPERRPQRHRGGDHARLGEAALLPAAQPGDDRRLGGEDRPLRRTLPPRGDRRDCRHAELAADLLRAARRDRRGEAHRRHLARARNAEPRRRRLGALSRPLRRPAPGRPGGDARGLPGERGVLRHRRPRGRRGSPAASRHRDLLRVRPARPARRRQPGLPLDRRCGAGGELRAGRVHLRRALALPGGRHRHPGPSATRRAFSSPGGPATCCPPSAST